MSMSPQFLITGNPGPAREMGQQDLERPETGRWVDGVELLTSFPSPAEGMWC